MYYGRSQDLAQQVPLKAGPLSLIYEAGDLRYIRLGDVEILRRIYSAVRDHNWNTIQPIYSNEKVVVNEHSFKITYDVTNRQKDIDFFWQGIITGEEDGTITFAMRGKAWSTFRRNRIGFCVLHPMDCAGVPVNIEHVDGSQEHASFPTNIAPQLVKDGHPCPVAPFENLGALTHQVLPNLWAETRFEGDTFEMEDQRNWTDASFKTYCTPLSLPFPAEIKAGTEINQSIRLSLHGEVPKQVLNEKEHNITFSISNETRKPMPRLGLGVASHNQPLNTLEIERIRALQLSHLRVDLHLSNPGYKARLQMAASQAESLGVSLEIALFLTDTAENELSDLIPVLQEVQPPVLHWLIFHQKEKTTTIKWVNLARKYLSSYKPATQIGSGSNAYFTEINAKNPPVDALDFVVYSINPQVHAFDNASITETLADQAVTVDSARVMAGGKPLAISPITLKPRFNPNATGPEPEPAPGELPSQVDVRQSSLYGLAWTLGSLKYLTESGVTSLTYYETTGWRGVLALESGSPLPEQFYSVSGGVYPIYHLFADLAGKTDCFVVPIHSSQPLKVEGLLLENSQGRTLFLANYTRQPQKVTLLELSAKIRLRHINETNVMKAMKFPEAFRQSIYETLPTQNGSLTIELLPFETVQFIYQTQG